jgi:Domain of unknown function (DUF5666)
VTIDQGNAVRWEWDGNGVHTVTSGSAGDTNAGSLFDETMDTDGDVVEVVFNEIGTFPYFSDTEADIANAMTGTVIVSASDSSDDEEDDKTDTRDGEDSASDLTPITVFSGAVDIDLISLTLLDVSSLITDVTLPAGEYKGMRLSIENPRLVLKADPATVITDVRLTANGRLFVKHEFDLGAGEDVLVTVNFGGINLVETGAGMYVLLPRLSISDKGDEREREVEFHGTIASIADDGRSMVVDLANGFSSVTVLFTDRTFIHLKRSEVRLTPADLAVDMEVEVEGRKNEDRTVTAKEVKIHNERGEVEFRGVIASVADDGLSMVVELVARGVSVTVKLTEDTFIHNRGFETPLTVEALARGKDVKVDGIRNGDGTVTAKEVVIRVGDEVPEVEFHGAITSVADNGRSIEVDVVPGFVTVSVTVNEDTIIRVKNSDRVLTAADLEVGMSVDVAGTANSDGSVTAAKIKIETERS